MTGCGTRGSNGDGIAIMTLVMVPLVVDVANAVAEMIERPCWTALEARLGKWLSDLGALSILPGGYAFVFLTAEATLLQGNNRVTAGRALHREMTGTCV